MKRRLAGYIGLLLLAACSPPAKPKAEVPAGYTELPIDELMVHVVDPAAQAFWSAAGFEVTQAGERDLSPTTEAGWKRVEDGAAGLIEAGNLLKLPGRPREPADKWRAHAEALTRLGTEAKAAAEAKDKTRAFEIGVRLDQACDACHADFRPAQPSANPSKQP